MLEVWKAVALQPLTWQDVTTTLIYACWINGLVYIILNRPRQPKYR